MNYSLHNAIASVGGSAVIALFLVVAMLASYIVLEPVVGRAQVSDQVVVTQTVTSEISFVTNAANVTLPGVGGISGGTANGSTEVRVSTNATAGFTMTLLASSSPAMQQEGGTDTIPDFTTTTNPMITPSYDFSGTEIGAGEAGFGYTIAASNSADTDDRFKDDGAGNCGVGEANDPDGANCWIGASTTAYQIMNRSSATPSSGATSTLFFRTIIGSNPVPAISQGTYKATTTLTATASS